MDNRLILTERQRALVKELYRLFRDFAKEEGRFIPVLDDDNVLLEPKFLEKYELRRYLLS